jgi:formiminotetrahydrofolate cyclodeaminase
VGTETLDGYLERMASGSATPGGGAAAAVQAALAAALVAMAARCTPFERFPQAGLDTSDIARVADECRAEALQLATADERAFAQVASAYRLPKDDDEQRRDRAASIQAAMENATKPPLDLLELAERVVGLAERLLPIANPNALADLAVGVGGAAAACQSSRLTVEANVKSIGDSVVRTRLRSRMGDVDKTLERAHRLTEAVSGRLLG